MLNNFLKLEKKLSSNFLGWEWILPKDLKHGILTTNQAFKESKLQASNPVQIAEKLSLSVQEFLDQEYQDLFLVVTVGGYINIQINFNSLDLKSFLTTLPYRIQPIGGRVMLESVSPNVGKPLHAGHILQANYAESLRRILSLQHETIITDSHWCDWGVPMGIMLWSYFQLLDLKEPLPVTINGEVELLDLKNLETDGMETLVKMYVWGNQQKEKVHDWDQQVRTLVSRLGQGDLELLALKDKFFNISKAAADQILTQTNFQLHHLNQGESFYEEWVKRLYEFLEKHNLWQKEGQGRYIDLADLEEMWVNKPRELIGKLKNFGRCYLVQSKDGYTTYAFRDIAARWQWASTFGTSLMLTFVGNEQIHHFNQCFAITAWLADNSDFQNFVGLEVAQKMGWSNLKVLHNGFVTLPEGKMSTRSGNFVTAKQILEATIEQSSQTNEPAEVDPEKSRIIAVAAMKWFNLNRDISQNAVLDIPAILKFEGNTGVYQLYTFARINSILNKFGEEEKINWSDLNDFEKIKSIEALQAKANWSDLNTTEREIFNNLLVLPEIIQQVARTYKPHLLCTHLYQIATQVNSWYAKNSVTKESNKSRQAAMLALCQLIKFNLFVGLDLLGIQTLESL